MSSTAEKFLTLCRLTCFGGSEKGRCSCTSPEDCELKADPQFSYYRNKAGSRILRHMALNSSGNEYDEAFAAGYEQATVDVMNAIGQAIAVVSEDLDDSSNRNVRVSAMVHVRTVARAALKPRLRGDR